MILVTGANGLIGRALAERLKEDGCDLRLQVRRKNRAGQDLSFLPDVDCREVDFLSAGIEHYDSLVRGCDTVLHTAGVVHNSAATPEEYRAINVEATRLLAEASRRNGVRNFVFLSTSAVYGSGPFMNKDESAQTCPDTAYGASKLECEQILRDNPPAPNVIIFRPSLVFGEGDRGNMIALIRQIKKGRYFNIKGNAARKSIMFSKDAAKAIIACMANSKEGVSIYNLTNPRSVGVVELANEIARLVDAKSPLLTIPKPVVRMGASVAAAVFGERAPLTPTKLDKLMTTTTLSTEALWHDTGFRPDYPLSHALSCEIQWANQIGLI